MNRLALWIADMMLEFVGRGTHTYVYASRVKDIRDEIFEMRRLYFGVKARAVPPALCTPTENKGEI